MSFLLSFQGFKQPLDTPIQPLVPRPAPTPHLSDPAQHRMEVVFTVEEGEGGQAAHPQGTWKQFPEKQKSI